MANLQLFIALIHDIGLNTWQLKFDTVQRTTLKHVEMEIEPPDQRSQCCCQSVYSYPGPLSHHVNMGEYFARKLDENVRKKAF